MNKPCKVTNSTPGQLNRENVFPCLRSRRDFAYARQVEPSRSTSARSCAVVVREIRDTEEMRRMLQLEHSIAESLVRYISVCYGYTYSKSMDQPGKVTNPARGQLNRENYYFPVRVRA